MFAGASIYDLLQRALRELERLRRRGGRIDVARPDFPYRVAGVSIYKPARRSKRHHPWLLGYVDPVTGKHLVETASQHVDVTHRQAQAISKRIDMHRLGQTSARDERLVDQEARPLLGKWIRRGGQKSYVPGHLDEYERSLTSKGRSKKHIYETCRRARKMIRLCRFNTIADVAAEIVEQRAGEVLRAGRDLSAKTCNDFIASFARLTRWMARSKVGRARNNPLADVEYFKAGDPRHARRPLTPEQFSKVLEETRRRPKYKQMSGPDRAAYYLVKVNTGFRNEETASLTPESFNLDSDPPTITVAAAYSKHRRVDVQQFDAQVADQLRPWVARKPAGQRVFKVPDKPNEMWRRDLEACGLAYVDADGRFTDLYSLRHYFATELIRAPGATIKTVQELMRHSDVRLTARYMHPALHDKAKALATLPKLRRALEEEEQLQLFTGTGGQPVPVQQSAHPQEARNVQRANPRPAKAQRYPAQSKKTQAPEPVGVMRLVPAQSEPATHRISNPTVAGSSPAGRVERNHAADQALAAETSPENRTAPKSCSAPGAARPGSNGFASPPARQEVNDVLAPAPREADFDALTNTVKSSQSAPPIDLLKLLGPADASPLPSPQAKPAAAAELARAMLELLARQLHGGAT